MWEYVKGSEADFEGAPDWAMYVDTTAGEKESNHRNLWFSEHYDIGGRFTMKKGSGIVHTCTDRNVQSTIIAERRKVDNLQSRVNDANLGDALKEMFKDTAPVENKYNRQCKGVTIDVYDVLLAFNVTNPALQHLVKKALCTGLRGHKDKSQDLQDILDSAKRAVQLESDK